LRAENDRLRNELEMSRSNQSSSLNEDLVRLEAIQRFNERGILVGSLPEFASLACDSLIELLGCDVAILLYGGGPSKGGEGLYQSGLGEISPEASQEMQAWADLWCLSFSEVSSPEALPLPQSIGLCSDFLVAPILDELGNRQGLIFACHKLGNRNKVFTEFARSVFDPFVDQLGVLMVSLIRHLTIMQQVETIRISEERLSTSLASNNVGLWDWDLVSGRIYYSPQWKRQLGLESDALSDAPSEWIDRIHPDDWDRAVKIVQSCCMSAESGFELTVRMRRKDGCWIWINSRGHHVSSPDGEVRRMIGTQIDVTRFKLLEERLLKAEKKQRLAKELAERENRAKSSFLAAVSHEIRTPLNGILGVFQMLRMTRELDRAKLDKLLEMGERSGKWMLRIIGESLDIARIEAGKLEIIPEVVDLDALLEDLKSVKSKRASHLGLELRWNVAPGVPRRILVDGVRLRQVLANLIVNSLKFTNQGFVAFEVSPGSMTKDGKQRLCFTVTDSGVGFSKEFGQVIFEPFTQGPESLHPREHGIGMGLTITRELVGLMGGKIKVTSRPGEGSSFTVTLPVKDMSNEILVGEPRTIFSVPSFRGRILLVDDDSISSEIGRMMLGELGFRVDLAGDGKKCLEMAESTYYDLILMDCWMPVMGGIEATRLLRASEVALSRGVPIIALTANAREADATECLAAGMDDFMVKPLLLDTLIDKLTTHLPPCPTHVPD
jgi:PAS domain S-box-containing protein